MAPVLASFTAAFAAEAAVRIDIPAQPADAALRRFSAQTGFQLLYAAGLLRGVRAAAVQGTMAPRDALRQLLRDSGIEIVDTGPDAATLRRAATPAPAPMAVLITARRFTEPLLDVPVAVSAFNGPALQRRGDDNIAGVLRDTPGVSVVENTTGVATVSIRGIATTLGGNANGFYLDDLPFTGVTVPIAPDVRAWDLERVEVLRGPQGTLFGEGSMGGTVRLLTNNARLDRFEFAGQLGASAIEGGGAGSAAKAMINLPLLANRVALRVAATHEREGGWIDEADGGARDVDGSSIDTARLRLHWRASDALSINTLYWQYRSHAPRSNLTLDDGSASQGTALRADTGYTLKGVSARYDLGPLDLFYSYVANRFTLPQDGLIEGVPVRSGIGIDADAHELRLASSGAGQWRWTAGVYRRDARRRDNYRAVYADGMLDTSSDTRSRALSVFGDVSYRFAALPLEASAGLRHFRDRLSNADVTDGIAAAAESNRFGSNTPRYALTWRRSDSQQVYISAAKGFRSGQNQVTGFSALAAGYGIELPAAIKPDSIWTREAGTKLAFPDRRSALELAAYHSDWKDVAVRVPLGDTGFNGLVSSNGTRTDGLEGSFTYTAAAFSGALAVSRVHARYAGSVPGTGIVDGAPVDDVAPLTVCAGAEVRRPLARGWRLAARAGLQYAARHPVSVTPGDLPGDATLNAHARLGFTRGHWTWTLYGDNLLGERGAASYRSAIATPSGGTEYAARRLRPRTIGVQMTFAIGE